MSNAVFIEDYTTKSFVVRGNTKEHKDSLMAMGGKWNNGLSDKETGDKFGAWLFWSDKRKEIQTWIEKSTKDGLGEKIKDLVPLQRKAAQSFANSRN